MRAGLGTILQTLTSEAATILNQAIAEAGRRNHGQTTPVHVAATLLASPTGFLRQACIKSHPNSSHPLQCRALELCFSVALERLPTAQNVSAGSEPPISNALMAALKRAQAHQRRGSSELQQQPLLAVKVEFEQLVISILDDPSVSRIMREASFSSPAVKGIIERSLNSSASVVNSSPIGLGSSHSSPSPNRSLYLNPRLHQGSVNQLGKPREEEVKRIVDILLRPTKRNPIVVGDSETDAMLEEFFRRINKKELSEGSLENAEIIHLEKEFASDRVQIPTKLDELEDLVASQLAKSSSGSIILDLGNLEWLFDQPASSISEAGRAAVQKIGKLLTRFNGRLWLIGTATCETFLRCQIYHPSIESDWDLHVVPVVAKAPRSGLYPRFGTKEILGSPIECLSSLKFFPTPISQLRNESESLNCGSRITCCSQCMQKYEQELQKLINEESEKSSSGVKTDSNCSPLPHWLQKVKDHSPNAESVDSKQNKEDKELMVKQRTQELQKKWNTTCLQIHPNFYQSKILSSTGNMPTGISTMGLYNQNLLKCQPCQPRLELNKSLGRTLQLNMNPQPNQPSDCSSIRTDLILGQEKFSDIPEQTRKDCTIEFLDQNHNSSRSEMKSVDIQSAKLLGITDVDSYKKILKVLMGKVWWQRDAASTVANTITQRKLGNRKRQGAGSKGDIWLLFAGPDKVGKRKMASAISELVSGSILVTICLGSQRNGRGLDNNFRGRTPLDQIAEAVRKNPFSVIVLENIDEADVLFRGSLKRAIESGRLIDSYGREISLGNIIFILTTVWLPDDLKYFSDHNSFSEKELATLASESWQLRLSLSEKQLKRRGNWLCNEERFTKTRKDTNPGLFFDLNEAANAEDDTPDGSHNSSDLTIDHEDEYGLSKMESTTASPALTELQDIVDDAIVFKPVNFNHITQDIKTFINEKFFTIIGVEGVSIELQDQALQKILAGVWLSNTSLEEWAEKALVPSFNHLKACFPKTTGSTRDKPIVVALELDRESGNRNRGDWLPSNIKVVTAVDGL
ncbi:protein SUPPRESSOR OF MAX2 1 [Cucumis melo var. makuwa]|uniref:Protein SUPPRESSOR OF MAX2 1 n=2 Tax=Cucumis melo TaxID=3656 RepID=A0A1S3BXL3_CUCME|nr:protein SUPPRESSOR OF MAX2 1 [Cucumis melo]KAA0059730.1 protein SUPPRESSOR OF MAX2 1 [Cucumis melo var. makuwa]TYK09462.1 protein SUPPRESSOR OF MAX2 1 [Cucumis melo var. makuwa]